MVCIRDKGMLRWSKFWIGGGLKLMERKVRKKCILVWGIRMCKYNKEVSKFCLKKKSLVVSRDKICLGL